MKQDSKLFPVLGLVLYFCTMNLGTVLTAVSRTFVGSGRISALLHFSLILGIAWALSRGARSGPSRRQDPANPAAEKKLLNRFQPLQVLLGLVVLASVVVPYLLPARAMLSWQCLLVPAFGMSVLLPVGLHVFFQAAPPQKSGFLFGMALAAGELVWVGFLPLLSMFFSVPHSPEMVLYIFKVMGIATAGTGICFVIALAAKTRERDGLHARPQEKETEKLPPGKAGSGRGFGPLFWLFAAGAVFYTLFGLVLLDMPRARAVLTLPGNLHFSLILAAPFAGLLLDSARAGKRGLGAVAAMLFLAALFVALLGSDGRKENYDAILLVLSVARQAFLLTLLTMTARLAADDPCRTLYGSVAYCFIVWQFAGILIGRALEDNQIFCQAAVLGFTCALALCLGRFFFLAAKTKELWEDRPLPPETPFAGEASGTGSATPAAFAAAGDDPVKRMAFAAAFGLTRRESEILEGLVRREDIAAIQQALGISERTVRFHLTGLLKKTGMANRQRLFCFYTAWKPD